MTVSFFDFKRYTERSSTLVMVVPARKNTVSRAKKTLQGWIAWTTAVPAATAIPKGVKDLREYAR